MTNLSIVKGDVTDVVAKEDALTEVNTDTKSYSRLGWLIVIGGVCGFLLWASFAPLDQGVPLSGNVAVASSRKVIQHHLGGTIDQILVKDGDQVKAGQVVAKMNDVQARSQLEMVRPQFYAAKASEARLLAERANATQVVFSEKLLALKNDPLVASNMSSQQQLFATRRMTLQSEMDVADETVAGLKAQLSGLQESMVSKKQQQAILQDQLVGMRDLAKDGYIARNRLLDLERTLAQVNGGISEDIGNMGRINRQISELMLRKIQRQQEYQREVRTILSDVQKEASALQSRIVALEFDLKNVEVKAPSDGTIVGLSVFTPGAVVASGFKLMELVPNGDALIIEGQLPVNLVDKVHKNLPVELIFSAFNSNKTPHIEGVITHVAADRSIDEHTGVPFYRVKAAVAPEGLKKIQDLQIRPGMPVEMVVKTGERTMMNYLLRPLVDRMHSAMKEE